MAWLNLLSWSRLEAKKEAGRGGLTPGPYNRRLHLCRHGTLLFATHLVAGRSVYVKGDQVAANWVRSRESMTWCHGYAHGSS